MSADQVRNVSALPFWWRD